MPVGQSYPAKFKRNLPDSSVVTRKAFLQAVKKLGYTPFYDPINPLNENFFTNMKNDGVSRNFTRSDTIDDLKIIIYSGQKLMQPDVEIYLN